MCCARSPALPPGGPPALTAEFAGCALVRTGPVCELPADGRLRLWIPSAEPKSLAWSTDQGALGAPAATPAGVGWRYELVVPASAAWLTVTDTDKRAVFRLPLQVHRSIPVFDEARALRGQGRADEASARLRAAMPALDSELASRARGLLARIDLQKGLVDTALATLAETRRAAAAAGRLSDWLLDTEVVHYALTFHKHDLAGARLLVDEGQELVKRLAPTAAQVHGMAALLAEEAGDLRSALTAYRLAQQHAERLGERRVADFALVAVARVLTLIGRADEGHASMSELLRRADNAALDPCNRAGYHHNMAWIAAVRHRQTGAPQTEASEPRGLFEQARMAYKGCSDRERWRHLLVDEADFALALDDRSTARGRLKELAGLEAGHNVSLSVAESDLTGRLALAEGRARGALAAFTRAAALARAAALPEGELAAETGLGRALMLLGQTPGAIAHLADAERLLDRLLDAVPLGEGRDAYLGARNESARLLVETLLDARRPTQAFTAARLARVRVLQASAFAEQVAGLTPERRDRWLTAMAAYRAGRAKLETDAVNDWRLDSQQLAAAQERRRAEAEGLQLALDEAYRVLRVNVLPGGANRVPNLLVPAPGSQATILFFRGRRGWLAFVQRAGALRIVRLAEASPARAWTRALASALAGVERIRVLGHPDADPFDLRAEWADISAAPPPILEYGLDLAERPSVAATHAALLIQDPSGDLPGTRHEIAHVRARLTGWAITALEGDSARRDRILELMPAVGLFHYAGHAAFAGVEGLESSLRSARGERILLTDVLALPSVPRLVVLSACDSARTRSLGGGSLGLAQAFVLAGAAAVIAPTQPVADRGAAELMAAVYDHLGADPTLDLPVALGRAQAELAARSAQGDWASFRAFVP